MSKSSKIPERMCIVCREMKPKNELIRLVLIGDDIKIDTKQKMQGRGVWVDKNETCIHNLEKRKSLNRTFKKEINPDIYKELESMINE